MKGRKIMLKRKVSFKKGILGKAGILGLSAILLAGTAAFPSYAAFDTDVKLMLDESAEAFDITMPTEMLLKVNGEGDVALASDFSIQNNSVYPVHVKGAALTPSGWNFYESSEAFSDSAAANSMFFNLKPGADSAAAAALSFGEAYSVQEAGNEYNTFSSGGNYAAWCIGSGESLDIVDDGNGKAKNIRNISKAQTIGKMTWTIEAADVINASALEGKTLFVTYLTGDGTFISGGTTVQKTWMFNGVGKPCLATDGEGVSGAERSGYVMDGFTTGPDSSEKLKFYDNGSPKIDTQEDIDFWANGGYGAVYVRWVEE